MDLGKKMLRASLEAIANAGGYRQCKIAMPNSEHLIAARVLRGSGVDAYLRRNGEQGKGKRRTLLDAPQRLGAITAPAKRVLTVSSFSSSDHSFDGVWVLGYEKLSVTAIGCRLVNPSLHLW